MRILINKQNNDKFELKKMFLLQSGIIPLSFLPTSGLFCKDATHILNMDYNQMSNIIVFVFFKIDSGFK